MNIGKWKHELRKCNGCIFGNYSEVKFFSEGDVVIDYIYASVSARTPSSGSCVTC